MVAGPSLKALPEGGLTAFRRRTVGFVFQGFNLSSLLKKALLAFFNSLRRGACPRLARKSNTCMFDFRATHPCVA